MISFVFFMFLIPTWFFVNGVHDALTQSQRRFCRLISLLPRACIWSFKYEKSRFGDYRREFR